MKTIIPQVLFSALAVLIGIVPVHALTIPASEDTVGVLNKLTSQANNSSVLQVDSTRTGLFYFNLDDIPEGSVVKLAKLRLYLQSVRSKGAGLGIHRVLGQWNEAFPGVQPEFEASPFAQIEASKLGSRRFVTVDVTALVQDWINSSVQNEGIAITSLATGNSKLPSSSVFMPSKEGPSLGFPAILDIELQDISEVDTPISMARLPESVRALVESGTLKLQNVNQLPDTLQRFLSPNITAEPSTPVEGGSLEVTAQGLGTLSYQWLQNGVNLEGATTARLSSSNLSGGAYSVVVSNGFSSVISRSVTIGLPTIPGAPIGTVRVNGGKLPSTSQLGAVTVNSFFIGKTEVTWGEWKNIRSWALLNGYTDLANAGTGIGDNYPVSDVNWYEAVKWCNARSQKEGKTPVYTLNGSVYRTGEAVPDVNSSANGYRLPTEAEWEFAAKGGTQTKSYTFSGSNDANTVSWNSENSNGSPQALSTKAPNELGIYDMNGNVWEWTSFNQIRGGAWNTGHVAVTELHGYSAERRNHLSQDFGFRVAFNLGQ